MSIIVWVCLYHAVLSAGPTDKIRYGFKSKEACLKWASEFHDANDHNPKDFFVCIQGDQLK